MLLNLGIRSFVSKIVIASIAVGTVVIIASTWSSDVDPKVVEQLVPRDQTQTGKTLAANVKQKGKTSPKKKERSQERSDSAIKTDTSQEERSEDETIPESVEPDLIDSPILSDDIDASNEVVTSPLAHEKAFAIEIPIDESNDNNYLHNESIKNEQEALMISNIPSDRRRNSAPSLSSDVRVSMWKIYHDCCCKMNDLEQLLFKNFPEKTSTDQYSKTKFQKFSHPSMQIPHLSRRTVMNQVEIDSTMGMQQDLEESCSLSTESEGSEHELIIEKARDTGLQRRRYHVPHNDRSRRFKKKKEKIYSWQMLQYLSKKNSFTKKKNSSFLLRRYLSSKSNSPEENDDDHESFMESQPSKDSSFSSSQRNMKSHVSNHSFSFSSVATTVQVEESESEDEVTAEEDGERLANNYEEGDDFRRMCIEQIYLTWKKRQLFKFVDDRIRLKRGFRALSQFPSPLKDHNVAIQVQAVWQGFQARQDFLRQQQERFQVIRTVFLQVYREHRFKILEGFCWKRLMMQRFFSNLKFVGYQRKLAKKRICMEVERWFCQRKKYLELIKRREKRRQWLQNRKKKEAKLKKKVLVKITDPTVAQTDDLVLIMELRRWVSQVMRQVHPDTKMIPPTAELMQSCPRLNSVIYVQRKSSRAQSESELYVSVYADQQVSEEFLQLFDHSSQQVRIIQKFLRTFVIGKRYKKAFKLASRRLNISTLLIQVAMKCRFAIMLLTAKFKYVHGLLTCQPLIRLGSHTCAAIIIQAAWRYSRSSIQWKKYIRVCKLRLAMLASRSRKCSKEIDHGKYREMVDYFRESWLQVENRSNTSRKLDVPTIRNMLAVVVPPLEDPFSPSTFSPRCA